MIVREFYETHHKPFLEASTAADYHVQLRHFAAYLGRTPTLGDLWIENLDGAVAWQLARGRTKDTADKVRRCLLALWNRAAELGKIDKPPEMKRRHRPTERVPTAWTIDQFGRILWAASQLTGRVGPFSEAEFFTALLWLVYNTGWRITAAMEMAPAWVDLEANVVMVEADVQKDDEGMQVTLLPETKSAIAPIVRHAKQSHHAAVFDDWPYDRSTFPRSWRTLTKRLKTMIVAAGLAEKDGVSRRDLFHKIRRTFATQIYIATSNIEEVRRMLGHSSIEVSYRYIDFAQVGRQSQAELLPRPKATRLRVVQ